MKKIVIALLIFIASLIPTTCFAEVGVVVYVDHDRNLIVMQTSKYEEYTCATIMSLDYSTDCGHTVVGSLKRYGAYELYNCDLDSYLTVYIEDWGASKDYVLDWIFDKQ